VSARISLTCLSYLPLSQAGKSTLASIIARALNWVLLDTDAIFEQQHHTSIGAFIKQNGWDAFRQAESEILADVLSNNTTEKVIACGGGVIELERNRELIRQFKEYGLVVHVLREKEDILEYIRKSDNCRPCCEMDASSWEETLDLFRECCSFEFPSLTVPLTPSPGKVDQRCSLKPVEQDFFRLLRFIHGVDTNKVLLSPGHRTYTLSLTYDDVCHAIPVIDDLSIGIDLWEIRVDLLKSWDLNFLSLQVAALRRHSPLPILFTVRTTSQGGNYPSPQENDHSAVGRLSSLLKHGLRLGVEYLGLEATYPSQINDNLPRLCGNTTTIGSYHDYTGTLPWTGPRMRQIYDSIVRMGVGVVQIINMVRRFEDNMSLRHFAMSVERSPIPLIAINMGVEVGLAFHIRIYRLNAYRGK
jgi:3-dehydroquinate dehydratase type I